MSSRVLKGLIILAEAIRLQFRVFCVYVTRALMMALKARMNGYNMTLLSSGDNPIKDTTTIYKMGYPISH